MYISFDTLDHRPHAIQPDEFLFARDHFISSIDQMSHNGHVELHISLNQRATHPSTTR